MPKTKVIKGSGNVFADIGVRDPEESLAKAKVARTINRIIAERRLTQTKAADILGIDQPRVCALAKGRLSLFSLEKLLSFVNKLGPGVEIKIGAPNSGIVVLENVILNQPHQNLGKLYGQRNITELAYVATCTMTATAPGCFSVHSRAVDTMPTLPAWLVAEFQNCRSNYNPHG